MVPTMEKVSHSAGSALEFSVLKLNVSEIIICGHSSCGAMTSLLKDDIFDDKRQIPHLQEWLKHGQLALERFRKFKENPSEPIIFSKLDTKIEAHIDPNLPDVDQLSQINVLQQVENLLTYPFVSERIKSKDIRVHAWWFDIGAADVYVYSERRDAFHVIDNDAVEQLLQRYESQEDQ